MRYADDASAAIAFERIDRAVYFAKSNGRDHVRSYATLVEEELLEKAQPTGEVALF